MIRITITISILVLAMACEPTEKELTNEEFIEFFNSFNPQWKQAIVSNEPAYIVDRYAEDAIIGPPNKNFIEGKELIEQYWTNNVGYMNDFWYKTQRIGGNTKDVFYESGIAYAEYEINNQTFKDTTKYLFVWKNMGNGEYKVLAEMFNAIPQE